MRMSYPTLSIHGDAAKRFLKESGMELGDEHECCMCIRLKGINQSAHSNDHYDNRVELEVLEANDFNKKEKGEYKSGVLE